MILILFCCILVKSIQTERGVIIEINATQVIKLFCFCSIVIFNFRIHSNCGILMEVSWRIDQICRFEYELLTIIIIAAAAVGEALAIQYLGYINEFLT